MTGNLTNPRADLVADFSVVEQLVTRLASGQMTGIEARTAGNRRLDLWVAFDYGGRGEIVEAVITWILLLAVAVPLVGFGEKPTLIALFAYGLLPIFENTIAGLRSCPPALLEAADGMGMSAAQRLATAASIDLAVARSHAAKRSPVASVEPSLT